MSLEIRKTTGQKSPILKLQILNTANNMEIKRKRTRLPMYGLEAEPSSVPAQQLVRKCAHISEQSCNCCLSN